MKKLILYLSSFFFLWNISAQSDEYSKAIEYINSIGEVYFTFKIGNKEEIKEITKHISIDNLNFPDVYAYANKEQFNFFTKNFGYKYKVLTHPGELIEETEMYDFRMKTPYDFKTYPTYEAYEQIMLQFESNYPHLCKIVDAGKTVQNRKLLFVKISDQVNSSETKPQFMFTATMHGDETGGYILMLRLINYLLSNYETNSDVSALVNNMEIWINPLANPDGTYASGNNTVTGARRYNKNNVDLNRNFPDPEDGDHPDGNAWQPETEAFMNVASQNNFIMAANFHGGAEVVSYPWDTWGQKHPDDAWFQQISHLYADLAQENSPPGYMDGFNDGITNGYDWYEVNGGRQDYMIYWHDCREVTIELSDIKLVPENQLNSLWEYNYRSLLAFMNEAQKVYCKPDLNITEAINGGEKKFAASNSAIASNTISGNAVVKIGATHYVRLTTGFKVNSGCSVSANLNGCTIFKGTETHFEPNEFTENENQPFLLYPNPANKILKIMFQIEGKKTMTWYNLEGETIFTTETFDTGLNMDVNSIPKGIYIINIVYENGSYRTKIIIE